MLAFRRVLITGASSGIGAALARTLAKPGAVLHLSGRDRGRLSAVAEACRVAGAEVAPAMLDVRDAAAMAQWIAGTGGLDLVLANAGVSAGGGAAGWETAAQVRGIFATNLTGVLNTVLPALALMIEQPPDGRGVRGRIGVVASLAAFAPPIGAPSYCASKSAIDTWTVGTAWAARRRGVYLTSLCPGFIATPMTASNPFPMPGMLSADQAATLMLRGIARGKRRVLFPRSTRILTQLSRFVPHSLSVAIMTRIGIKVAAEGGVFGEEAD
jgi:NAD(P)-dependent dehydrogenase (short-subunit alcohol dehydrogenase family)